MSLAGLIVLGVALSMDAFAVTVSNTFVCRGESRARMMLMPIFFGLFQGLMPLLGYFLGNVAGELIETYSGIVTLVILGVIGGNMVREGMGAILAARRGDGPDEPEVCLVGQRLDLKKIIIQSFATAIDAFAVGVSLRAMSVNVWEAAIVIALTTFACCVAALLIGRKMGDLLGDKAEVVGGVVLIAIGLKAFFS